MTFPDFDSMEEDFLEQVKGRDIDLVVCSDAEAILGIGDQGVGVTVYFHLQCLFSTLTICISMHHRALG